MNERLFCSRYPYLHILLVGSEYSLCSFLVAFCAVGYDANMRCRNLLSGTTNALRSRVERDGLLRSAVALGVSPNTLVKALRGAPMALAIARRLEDQAM